MSFKNIFDPYSWNTISEKLYSKKEIDVEHALYKNTNRTLDDFMALVSPAAIPFLKKMVALSQNITQRRFGKTIQMYIPLYLSNECQNICSYCGFSVNNRIKRRTLTFSEILDEVKVIKSYGFDHILLVTGESKNVHLPYFKKVLEIIRPFFSDISMEVQPLNQKEYEELISCGLNNIYVYQETYHKENYSIFHPKGKKKNFYYRLETPDRLGISGIHKIGLGNLIGLSDWRIDAWFVALHLQYLENKFWKTKYSISFPRLRPAKGEFTPPVMTTEKDIIQLIAAYRILNEDVELSLSTRESKYFRDYAFQCGVTAMSAGSKTEPGGYALQEKALEQFEVEDNRSPEVIQKIIESNGYDMVWKNWDSSLRSVTFVSKCSP